MLKKNFLLRLFYVFAFCVWNLLLPAQQPFFATRHYTTDHGLPSPEVYDILEDQQGYLWFSTDNGVSRFNGYAFENFGPKQGLQNNVVFFLQEDHLGRIWMPTLSGKVYYFEGDTIKPYPYNHILDKYSIQSRQLGQFHVDRKGVFHVALMGFGFIAIQPNGQYRLYSDELPCGAIIYEVEDQFLNIFIPCSRNSETLKSRLQSGEDKRLRTVFLKDTIQKELLLYNDQPSPFTGETMIKLEDGKYLSYWRGFLYLFNNQKDVIWTHPYPRAISFMGKSKNGQIYITDDWGKGIRVYEEVAAIRQNKYTLYLSGNSISHVIEDNFGGIWFATIENGVFYSPNQSYDVYNEASGLSNEYVTAVAVKDKEEIYLGLRNGEIFHLACQKNTLLQLPLDENDQEVFDLEFEQKRQRLWKGARRLEYLEDGRWNRIKTPFSRINAANKKFNINATTDLICGASSGASGFGLVKLSTAELIFNTSRLPELRGRTLVAYQDLRGRIWIGRINGLFEFRDNELIQAPTFHEALQFRVEDIAQLQDSTFVIGTKGGGVVLWKDSLFFQINESEGLTSSMIENIHIDSSQNIWVGTLNGLNHITWKGFGNFSIEKLTIADGLPSNEINDIASWGRDIWVATTRGLVRLPAEISLDSIAGTPILEQVLINNQPISLGKQFKLPHYRNHFQLKYLTINYQLNGQIEYRYRLNPDKEWIHTKERNINLAALAPDHYEFEIQSQNEDGFWSESAYFFFIIKPPFWQTWWFWSIVVLGLIAGGFIFYKNRLQHLQKEAQLEREKVAIERQMIELKQAALRAQMNPHFIFNCLNSIQGFIASGDKGRATRYLSRFAKLIRATLDATLEASISLKSDIGILENYLEMEQMRFKQKFNYQINIDERINLFEVEVPPLLVQPYVENSIVHGLSQLNKMGRLEIVYKKEKEHLKVSIIDNGIGILESKRRKSKQAVMQQPLGMSITRRRLELLDQASRNNKVRVEELKAKSGEILGTKVTLLIRMD